MAGPDTVAAGTAPGEPGAGTGSPPSRHRLRDRLDELSTPGGLLLVAAVLITAIAVTSAITDPDFWWHLRTGQLLIANHLQLLGHDPYTYTVPTHHWTMHEWLFEVAVAALYKLGGLGAIVPVLSLLTWLGVVFILLRARLHTRNRLVLGVGLIVAALAANPIWGPRDQMVDFTFSCVVLLLIERHLMRGGRALWLLLPLFLLWSNLHGGFVVGLAFAALIVVAEAAGLRLGLPDPVPPRRIATLAAVTVLCTLVSMVNPNGPGILLYAAETLASPAQQALILEWQSPDFHQLEVRGFAVMLVSLLGFLVANRRIRARDAVLVAATTALAFESVRNVAIFVAAATPTWIEQLNRLFERFRPAARPGGRRRLPLPGQGHRAGAHDGGAARRLGGAAPGPRDDHQPHRGQLRGDLPGVRQRLASRGPSRPAHLQPVRGGRLSGLEPGRHRRQDLHLRRRRADGRQPPLHLRRRQQRGARLGVDAGALRDPGGALRHRHRARSRAPAEPALGDGVQRPPQPGIRPHQRARLPPPPPTTPGDRDLRRAGPAG